MRSLGDSQTLLNATRESLLIDLNRITNVEDKNDANPFKRVGFQAHTLGAIEAIVSQSEQASSDSKILALYSENILPRMTDTCPQEAETLRTLLSLLFSVPATQLSCERLFSKATSAFDAKRSAMLNENLQAIVTIQQVFTPNTQLGILSALNAVRRFILSLPQQQQSHE